MKKVVTTPAPVVTTENTPKEAPVSRASILDQIILSGGTWEELTAKADAAAAELKTKVKHYTPALFKTHMRYREAKRKNFFSAVKVTDTGVEVK